MPQPNRRRPRVYWTLDPDLVARLVARARRQRKPVSRMVEQAVARLLEEPESPTGKGKRAA